MRQQIVTLTLTATMTAMAGTAIARTGTERDSSDPAGRPASPDRVERATRTAAVFLVNDMNDGRLKRKLQQCSEGPFKTSEFSIGHRGAALQFPEHTREAYQAGARMGAGILECDVTFTKDLQLVCRHAQNDLHTTTNILLTPLAGKCTRPFSPADGWTGWNACHAGERRMPDQ